MTTCGVRWLMESEREPFAGHVLPTRAFQPPPKLIHPSHPHLISDVSRLHRIPLIHIILLAALCNHPSMRLHVLLCPAWLWVVMEVWP